jgi:ParB family transcriptional regulator, chromosome partitioning protein
MSAKKKTLGRGMDSLLPQNFDQSFLLDEGERIQKIDITKIKPNKDQPRKHFDDEAINQLAESIKHYGILQPLIVSPTNGDSFIIIAGERRFRAALKAGLAKIPVIVRSSKELEQLEIALVENVQRVDLSPLEQAASIERLHEQFNMSYTNIANRLGKADTTIVNIVRLLQLPNSAKTALKNNKISEGHARAILALKDSPDKQEELLANIINNKWSVRQAEQFVVGSKKEKKTDTELDKHMTRETKETEALSSKLSAPVTIRRTAKGGKLEIGFSSDKNLNEIITMLLD